MRSEYVLEMLKIDKEFPGVKALQQVTFQLRKGEIHGLVGENGAGKSTLMKILAGIYSPDRGEIRFEGQVQNRLTPRLVAQKGIHFIHQERHVVPYLTVAETLFLGIEPAFSPFKFINRKALVKEAEAHLRKTVGLDIPGDKPVGELTVGEQQLLQVCRALYHRPKVIVFDEPTAVLASKEADRLFEIIRELRRQNIGIIYISHYLNEIVQLCDRITVFRNGTKVDTLETKGLDIERIVYLMVGREIGEQFPVKKRTAGEPLLRVEGLTHIDQFRNIRFQVRSGEIVGVTGLMGSGHTRLGQSIYDGSGLTGGVLELNGRVLKRIRSDKAVSSGMGYVPEDRRNRGILQSMSVRENISLASLKNISRAGVVRPSAERRKVDELIERLDIRAPGREAVVNDLSGGNQQKVVLARWLSSGAKLYILNQPTAAVDVGAKAEIYSLIGSLIEQGAGVLLISQDLQELVRLSDRILVMYRGEIVQELEGDGITVEQVMVAMMGGNENGTSGQRAANGMESAVSDQI